MHVVVCGSGGMLAADVSAVFNQRGHKITDLSIKDLDITELEAVRVKLRTLKPCLVFNAAGYTNVDGCEYDPDLAYQVNCLGARNLAVASEELGVPIVHISTDYVFGGKSSRPYREYDSADPVNTYGRSKYDGELMVRHHCPHHYIVRTSWLFGNHGNNFIQTMLRLAGQRDSLRVVDDQMGSPTYTRDLAEAITELVEKPAYGTYHLTNSDCCTWFTFAQEIFKIAGVNNINVESISTKQLDRPAERPRYSVLDNYLWRLDGHIALRSYKDALTDYLAEAGILKGGS